MSDSTAVAERPVVVSVEPSSPAVVQKPYTGTLPVVVEITVRSPIGNFAMTKTGSNDQIFVHTSQPGVLKVVGSKVVVEKTMRKRLLPEVGTKLVIPAVIDPLPGKMYSRGDRWVLEAEWQEAQAKADSFKPYVCESEPRKNRARITWVKLSQEYGRAKTTSGEETFVHPGNRLGVRRSGVELEVITSKETGVPVGIDVYFRGLTESTREGGLRVMQGWIPCSELDAADAEVAAEKVAIEARQAQAKVNAEARQQEQLALLAKARMTQAAGTFTPATVDAADMTKNRAVVEFISPTGWVKFVVKEGGEILFALMSRRRGAFLNSATSTVDLRDRPAADAKVLAEGDEVLFAGIESAREEGQARQSGSWIVASEYEKFVPAARKSAQTLSELAAETAKKEAKRREGILAARSSSGKGSGQGKKGQKKN